MSHRQGGQEEKPAGHTCSPLEWWHQRRGHVKASRADCSITTFNYCWKLISIANCLNPYNSKPQLPLWTASSNQVLPCPAVFCMDNYCDMLRKCTEGQQLQCLSILKGKTIVGGKETHGQQVLFWVDFFFFTTIQTSLTIYPNIHLNKTWRH